MTAMRYYKTIEQLVEKFLDGATTNAEEQTLYDYFAGEKVDRRLEQYKPMFRWYAGGMTDPLPAEPPAAAGRARTLRMRILATAGIAASVLLIGGAAIGYHKHMEKERLYATYEGSYIVRGGKKITDLKAIMPELKRIERDAEAMACRSKNIGRMSPEEIFKMMEKGNKDNNHKPTI